VFYFKMKGDYYRYLAEFQEAPQRDQSSSSVRGPASPLRRTGHFFGAPCL